MSKTFAKLGRNEIRKLRPGEKLRIDLFLDERE